MIEITRPHHTTHSVARARVQALAGDLAATYSLRYRWVGDRLEFSRFGAKGHVSFDDTYVTVLVRTLPFLPISDTQLHDAIEDRLRHHFPPPEDTSPAPDSAQPDAAPNLVHELANFAGVLASQAVRFGAEMLKTPFLLAQSTLIRPEQWEHLSPMQRAILVEMGQTLRQYREQAGLSLRQLADQIDETDVNLLEQAEAGRALLSSESLTQLVARLVRTNPEEALAELAKNYSPELLRLIRRS